MTKHRRILRRALSALLTLAALAGVGAATVLPLPTVSRDAAMVDAVPDVTPQTLVCPGPVRVATAAAGTEAGRAVGKVALAAGSGSFRVVALDGTSLTDDDLVGTWRRTGLDAPVSVQATTNAAQDAAAAAQGQIVDTAELSGLVASECEPVSFRSWLVGGNTETGRSTMVRLVNPGEVEAQVSITASTRQGVGYETETPIVVPAGSERTVPVSSFVDGTSGIALEVVSSGGAVAAFLQQSVIRGLTPGGLSLSGASAESSTRQVVTGIRVTGADEQRQIADQDAYMDATNLVRVLSPSAATEATVRVLGEGGEVLSDTVDVPAGGVADLDLSELDNGLYTVEITADTPVVAAVRLTRGGGEEPDLQWMPSQASTSGQSDVAVPPTKVGEATMMIASGSAQQVTVTDAAGNARKVDLPGELRPVSVEVEQGASYRLEGTAPYVAAVVIGDGNWVSGYGVTPMPSAASGIAVAP